MTIDTLDCDPHASDALAAMSEHMSGPLGAVLEGQPVALSASGTAELPPTRGGIVVVALAADLAATPLALAITIGAAAPVTLTFAAHSERGATLAVALPLAAGTTTLALGAGRDQVSVRYAEGLLAQLIYILASEKSRLRAVARRVAAGRFLDGAQGAALDRLGEEVQVPRFRAALHWDPVAHAITATPGAEDDAPYRERLRIYRGRVKPTKQTLTAALAGDAGGLIARAGYAGHLAIEETDTELAIAIRLVSPPDDTKRKAYLQYLRDMLLLPATATALPTTRPVSNDERISAAALLASLKLHTTWPANAFVAQATAAALDRAARVISALAGPLPLVVTRAQADDAGSRYELGLGVDIPAIAPAALDAMAAKLLAKTFAGTVAPDLAALLASLAPVPSAQDPTGEWLWRGCGIRTVHALAGAAVYLSHLPIHGATLDVATDGNRLKLTAASHSAGDGPYDANLTTALAKAAKLATIASPWTTSAAAPSALVAGASVPTAPVAAAITAAGLRTPLSPTAIAAAAAAVGNLPAQMVAPLQLAPVIANDLANQLPKVVGWLRAAGVVSVLPVFVAPATVYLLAASVDLPDAATLDRRRTQFRWLAVPLGADARIGTLEPTRSAVNHYAYQGTAALSQLAAVIAVLPAKASELDSEPRIDPYTVAVDVPDGQPVLGFAQYEYVMNLLERWCPLGITVDTSRLRDGHVDLDGDGAADVLDRSLQHTFRSFRGRSFGARR